MAEVATGSDALQWQKSSVEIQHLHAVGTIRGVKILQVAARNGKGTGRLRSTGDGTLLSWREPGAANYGGDCPCASDGDYLLLGSDPGKWIRIRVYEDFLFAGPREEPVLLDDVYNNEIGSDDVTAGEASAGDVETYTVTVKNMGTFTMTDVRFWLDPAVSDLEIGFNGADWFSPTTEETAIELGFPFAPAASGTIHFRRTTGAAAPSDPKVLNNIHARFDGW